MFEKKLLIGRLHHGERGRGTKYVVFSFFLNGELIPFVHLVNIPSLEGEISQMNHQVFIIILGICISSLFIILLPLYHFYIVCPTHFIVLFCCLYTLIKHKMNNNNNNCLYQEDLHIGVMTGNT